MRDSAGEDSQALQLVGLPDLLLQPPAAGDIHGDACQRDGRAVSVEWPAAREHPANFSVGPNVTVFRVEVPIRLDRPGSRFGKPLPVIRVDQRQELIDSFRIFAGSQSENSFELRLPFNYTAGYIAIPCPELRRLGRQPELRLAIPHGRGRPL